MNIKHDIYLISDSTGETLDRIFLALKAQFLKFVLCKHVWSPYAIQYGLSRANHLVAKSAKVIFMILINDFNFFKQEESTHLITRHDYDLEPLYGLNIIPEILSPFDKRFINEIKFLKTFTAELIKKQLDINYRCKIDLMGGI